MTTIKALFHLVAALVLASGAQAATYRWVDEQGKVHYGDTLPPQQAGRASVELDKQGRVKKENPRTALSPEERRRQEEATSQAEAAKRQEQVQRRRDKSLLSTYVSEEEIDLARDRAVGQEMSTLSGLRVRLKAAAEKLDYANRQLATHQGKVYLQMRDEATAEQAQLADVIRRREAALEETRARFEADKLRFRELRAATPR